MTDVLGTLFVAGFGLAAFAGWCTHLYVCFNEEIWGFLIAGALFFPVAVVHGWGLWAGLW